MATYTMTEDGRQRHTVDRDGDVLARDLDYNAAKRLIHTQMGVGDFYQEDGLPLLSYAQVREERERLQAYDRRHPRGNT